MAHGMTNRDKMFSVREAPWHMGLGTNVMVLDSAPETRDERMRLAGHNWTVNEEPVYRRSGEEVPGFKILSRSDTNHVFNCPSVTYGVVQNDTCHELFEALSKGARMDDGTGGTIKDGAVCYLSARLDEPIVIKGDKSQIFPYVVTTWAHDGSGSVQSRSTNIRPVCWNTLSWGEMVSAKAGTNFTFRHSTKVAGRIEQAMEIIHGARSDAKAFEELANELAALSVSDKQREEFVTTFIPAPATTTVISDRVLDNITEARDKVRAIFESPTIDEPHRNTGYGLLQAGLEYLDHLRGYRSQSTYLGRTLLRDEPLKAKLVPMIKELVKA